MSSFLLGLLCLCTLSVDGKKGVENHDVVSGLFSWIAGYDKENDNIVLEELITAGRSTDYNKDGYLSGAEVRAGLEELNLPPSSYAEMIFGSLNLNNITMMKSFFDEMDQQVGSGIGRINQTEFESYYKANVGILDWIQKNKRRSIKCTFTPNGPMG